LTVIIQTKILKFTIIIVSRTEEL